MNDATGIDTQRQDINRPAPPATLAQYAESRQMWIDETRRWMEVAKRYKTALEQIANLHPHEHDEGMADLIAREALS